MQLKSFIAIVLLITAFGCKKNSATPNNEATILTADWEFRSSVGGERLPIVDTPGNGNIYSFANTTYKYFEKNIARDSGIYSISQTTDPNTGEALFTVSFGSSLSELFVVRGDSLIFYDGPTAIEPIVNTYVKVSK